MTGDSSNPDPLTYEGCRRVVGIVPFLGSGPQNQAPLPLNIAQASRRVMRSTSMYRGNRYPDRRCADAEFHVHRWARSRFVFAQLVDDSTGLVVGSISTPVPVTMDGRQHTIEIPMENIAYTAYDAEDSLTLQITSSATAFWNFTSLWRWNISNIKLDVPTVATSG